jgi:hypothetical protein
MTTGSVAEAARREPSVADFRHAARSWLAAADVPRLPLAYAGRAELLRAWHYTLYRAGWVGI